MRSPLAAEFLKSSHYVRFPICPPGDSTCVWPYVRNRTIDSGAPSEFRSFRAPHAALSYIHRQLKAATCHGKRPDRTKSTMIETFVPGKNHTSVPAAIHFGRVLRDRYVLEKRLGSGGRGTVFKALDRQRSDLPAADQYVALKVLREDLDNQAERVAQLRREFYCVQALSHRNIVNVYDMDRDGETVFFTMELLEGELLSAVTERLHPVPVSRPYAWEIIREVGSALAHAHARGVVHGDLKPCNIMITDSGEVRIFGFGAPAAPAEGSDGISRDRNTRSAATTAYASCEILAGRPADPRDDIYALACLSYELLAGAHPFQRRRSTEARDFRIVPRRPQRLTRRQWQTLAMGLSWHRAARSISAGVWLYRMNTERGAAGQLPHAWDLKSAPPTPRPRAPMRAAALFAALLVTVALWASFIRWAPGNKLSSHEVDPVAAASVPPISDAGPTNASPANSTPQSTLTEPQEAQFPGASNVLRDSRDTSRSKPPASFPDPIVVSASSYSVRPGEHFAEIRVHRSRLNGDSAFVWWTEAASAKPGIDYVHQEKVIQSIPKGKRSTSFFVRLVPNASRTQREVFYIAIAEPGRGASLGQIAHAAIWLPTTHDPS
jgi:serine/threonine protein kinase